jgi:mono/diheme cytochrome c family protein
MTRAGLPTFAADAAALALVFAVASSCAQRPPSLPSQRASASTRQPADDIDRRYVTDVQPLLKTYCHSCHGGSSPAAKVDLTAFDTAAEVIAAYDLWQRLHGRLDRREMPPRGAPQPTDAERRTITDWFSAVQGREAERHAGDPGLVLARRLSNAEYDYTIQDLTGVAIAPTRAFPVDPANEAGFDNSGETLSISPALLTKYVDAARNVADHIVFQPRGFSFAPHEVVTEPDRDRFVVNRIMDFYRRQRTDLADYFVTLWRYENRSALGLKGASLASMAAAEGVSLPYLQRLQQLLQERTGAFGPIAGMQQRWDALPSASTRPSEEAVRAATRALGDYVIGYRTKLAWKFDVPQARPLHIASQITAMHVNRQEVAHRRLLNQQVLITAGTANSTAKGYDADLVVPSDPAARAAAVASLEKFCDVVPDAFVVTERTSPWLAKGQTGRLLSAGFHSAMGYFRDDGPLYQLLLDDAARRELDELWRELDFVSNAPARQLAGFVWFERTDTNFMLSPEFNRLRAEDQDLATDAKFGELRRLYEAKVAASGATAATRQMTQVYFDELGAAIRRTAAARVAAGPSHLEQLVAFAERAHRRPTEAAERDALLAFYHRLRQSGLGHEEAIRDTLASVLVSPDVLYRVDVVRTVAQSRIGDRAVAPLTDYSLAQRLSYFLWSSMPDAELLARAAAGDLHRPAVLRAQVRRMLRDDRISRLATEFGTNWLGVRRFEEFNSVDRERFPAFTNDLRRAFFEEPVRFLTAVIREDRPVTDLLFGDYTYVNRPLASHYGMPQPEGDADRWVRVDKAGRYQRGGLLPMAVFLTQTSPGQRTSPVKRGYWIARNVLGQHIPAPPPDVPAIPSAEADLGNLTLAQTMARHRADPNCASCHATFDFFGLAYEAYGPVGERRERDLGGRMVDPSTEFPDGVRRSGVSGIREYVRTSRQRDFVDNLSRRLVSYALGRGVILSDRKLLDQMQDALRADGYRFSTLVETLVTSPQFLLKRVP